MSTIFFGVDFLILFTERLQQLQESKQFLKKDIANNIEISVMAYYRYEKGERIPTADILCRLADFFDVSIDYLVGRTDNPNSHKATN